MGCSCSSCCDTASERRKAPPPWYVEKIQLEQIAQREKQHASVSQEPESSRNSSQPWAYRRAFLATSSRTFEEQYLAPPRVDP